MDSLGIGDSSAQPSPNALEQALTTVVALPFMLVIGLLCMALYKGVRSDPMILREEHGAALIENAVVQGQERHDADFGLVTEPVADSASPD
ncbi:hypothetical protein [Nocardia sp. NPDC050175]|uniref:hypothetical protein n=1 Tax=Nocardia sp. NPDC050175 TaxID=3364317 RepID=UPI0037A54D5B